MTQHDTVALLTPIPNGKVLAALCALNKIRATVLETSAGAFAVIEDTSESSTDNAGRAISAFVRDRPMLAMERRAGQITIHRWLAGQKGESVAPGLALDQAPGAIVSLMTGAQHIDDLAATHDDKVFDANMGRFKAFMQLRALARDAKKRARRDGTL